MRKALTGEPDDVLGSQKGCRPSNSPWKPPSKTYQLLINTLYADPYWVIVKGFNLSYQNRETILFTIDPYYGNLN